MRNLLVLTMLLFGLTANMYAQRDQKQKEKMDALKIAYLTENLDLTKQQWQAFWPVYNEYSDEFEKRMMTDELSAVEDPSSMTADQKLNAFIQKEQSILDMKKQYIEDIKNATNSETALQVIQAEKNFRKRLLKRFKNERKGKMKKGEKREKRNGF